MADDTTAGYTRGERAAGIFGALLFLGLLVIAVDLATGGKVFNRGGCGCGQGEQEAAGDS
jgi:hypothetical protein